MISNFDRNEADFISKWMENEKPLAKMHNKSSEVGKQHFLLYASSEQAGFVWEYGICSMYRVFIQELRKLCVVMPFAKH